MDYSKSQKLFFCLLTLTLLPLSGLSIDIYVPSLPAVTTYFQTDKAHVQLTLTSYMLGLGITQLFAGSITDSFGRKRPFNCAMVVYILATLAVPFATTIFQLQLLRFFQGVAIALTVVPLRSVVTDLYQGRELQIMLTYMTTTWSVGPIIAPWIGGYLQAFFGWKASFYFLAMYAFIFYVGTLIVLPETSTERHDFKLKSMFARYAMLFTSKPFILALLINTLTYIIIVLFNIVGPFLLQNQLGFSAIDYGHVALFLGIAWFLGVMSNRFLLNVPFIKKSIFCYSVVFIANLFLIIYALVFGNNTYAILIPIMVMLYFSGIPFPNYYSFCISLFPNITGSANAFAGSLVFTGAGIGTALGTLLKATSIIPLALAYLIIVIGIWVLFLMLKPYTESRHPS